MARQKTIKAWVYLIENNSNFKKYVGITNKPQIEDRWKQHLSFAENGGDTIMARAIRKYGADAFTLTVLEECKAFDTAEQNYGEAQEFEKLYIDHFNTLDDGYNMAFGGGGAVGRKVKKSTRKKLSERVINEEWKEKISKASKGNTKWAGKKHSDNSKDLMRKKGKERWANLSDTEKNKEIAKLKDLAQKKSFLGRSHSEETKQKLSEERWSVSEEDRYMIALRFSNGELGKDIAEDYGISRSVVQRIAKIFDVKKRGFAQTLSDEDIGDLYFNEEVSVNEICKKYEMSKPTVYRALQREREVRGIKKGVQKFVDLNALGIMRENGMTYKEIMENTGLSETAIIARLKELKFIK